MIPMPYVYYARYSNTINNPFGIPTPVAMAIVSGL